MIFCRPPSHPSLPKAKGAEGLKWVSGGGKGQGQAGGRARSEAKLGLGWVTRIFFARGATQTCEIHTSTCAHTRARKHAAIMKPAADVSLMSATLLVFMQSVVSY